MDPTDTPDPPGGGEPEPKKRKKKRGYYARLLDDDRILVVGRSTGRSSFPAVCMKCGSHKDILRRPTKLQWTPLWARMLVFCFLGLILMAVMTKRAELEIPLCPQCNERWTVARAALISGAVVLIVGLIGVRFMDKPTAWLPALGIAVVAFLVMVVTFVRPRMLQVHKMDDECIHLKGFHPGAAYEIVEGSS